MSLNRTLWEEKGSVYEKRQKVIFFLFGCKVREKYKGVLF